MTTDDTERGRTPSPDSGDRDRDEPVEPVEQVAEEAKAENPDPITARETFELELMEEGRSEEGESVELEDDGRSS